MSSISLTNWLPSVLYTCLCLYKYTLLFYEIFMFLRQLLMPLTNTVERQTKNDIKSIDVFITCYKESFDIIRETIDSALTSMEHMQQIEQLDIKLYVLDDARNEEVRKYVYTKSGAYYIARRDHDHAKAGNLNNALSLTDGDAIVFLDADANLVHDGIFKLYTHLHGRSDGVAWIQGIKDFEKRLPRDKRYLGWFDASEQIHSNAFNIVNTNFHEGIFLGSGAIFMRGPLKAIGYIPTGSVGEDVDTSFLLQQSGYAGLSINHVITHELPCLSLKALVEQRVRWHNGDWQRLRLYKNMKNLNGMFINTSCFLSGTNIWISMCVNIVFYQRDQGTHLCVSLLFELLKFIVLYVQFNRSVSLYQMLSGYTYFLFGGFLRKVFLNFVTFPHVAVGPKQVLKYDRFVSTSEVHDAMSSHDKVFHHLEKPYTLIYWTVLFVLDSYFLHAQSQAWIRASILCLMFYLALHMVCIQKFSFFGARVKSLIFLHHVSEILISSMLLFESASTVWYGYIIQRIFLLTELTRVLFYKNNKHLTLGLYPSGCKHETINRFIRYIIAPSVVLFYAKNAIAHHQLYFMMTIVSGCLNYGCVRSRCLYKVLFSLFMVCYVFIAYAKFA